MLCADIMKNTACIQLELGVTGKRQDLTHVRYHRRKRAEWWFGKMRQVVELAVPPHARAGAARPEQSYLNLRQSSLF
jgi:hypothetical protein